MPVESIEPTVKEAIAGLDSHGAGRVVKGRGIAPLAGRAVVEEVAPRKSILITRDDLDSDRKWYRGRVLALGPPGVTPRTFDGQRWVGGVKVPWGLAVGDEILFEPSLWVDKMRTFEFFGVQGRVWVVGQVEVMAVID